MKAINLGFIEIMPYHQMDAVAKSFASATDWNIAHNKPRRNEVFVICIGKRWTIIYQKGMKGFKNHG